MSYTVTFNANGGSNPPSPIVVNEGQSISQPSTPTADTYAIYLRYHDVNESQETIYRPREFLGWYTDSTGGSQVNFPYTPNASVTLYAHWGNSTAGTLPSATEVGYTFNGWYTDRQGGTQINSNTVVTSNITYHGQWTPNSYSISYLFNDGSYNPDRIDSVYIQEDRQYAYRSYPSSYTFIDPAMNPPGYYEDDEGNLIRWSYYFYVPYPWRKGYTFAGWNVAGLDTCEHKLVDTQNIKHVNTLHYWTYNLEIDGYYPGRCKFFNNLRSTTGAVIFSAVWTPIQYSIKYYVDGVEQTSLEQVCEYGATYTYQPLPSVVGHSVEGWYTNSNYTGSVVSGSFSSLTPIDNAVIRRYAKSNPNTYVVSYSSPGSAGVPPAQTKTYGVDLTLSSAVPTKQFAVAYELDGGTLPSGTLNPSPRNCTFNNWRATDGTIYSTGGTYTKNEATTLTAQWISPTVGTLPTPTRSGYRFVGWFSDLYGQGTYITPDMTINNNVVIYAVWKEQVTLFYDVNGGSTSVASDTKDVGSTFTIKSYSGTKSENLIYDANGGNFSGSSTTTRSANMNFNGWADSGSSTAQYVAGDTIVLNANKTIYAVWSSGSVTSHPSVTSKTVILTYNPNGGTIPVESNRTKYVSLALQGWATTRSRADAGTIDYATNASIPTGITVYAVWGPGSVGTLPTINIFTSRTGYRLDVDTPWTTTQNGSTEVTPSYSISMDTTIYAKWEYRIIIDGNGGYIYTSEYEGVSILEKWKKYGVNYVTPNTIIYDEGDPEETSSRTFVGYSTSSSGSVEYNPGFTYTSNSPITLYAVYQIETFTVKFTDGYSVPEYVLKTQVVPYGGSATPPADPDRPGYTFYGWIGSYQDVRMNTTVKASWGTCPIWIRTSTGWQKYNPVEEN